ncbi:MAG: hypothetical protein WA972_12745 [Rhodococcus qingshengii]
MRNTVMKIRAKIEERVDLSSDRSVMTPEAALVLGSISVALGVVWWAL